MGITIRELGNNLLLNVNGLKSTAYRVSTGLWIVSGDGTPSSGDFIWPFDLSRVPEGGEFGPRPSPGGIGSTDHKGMDFSGSGITGMNIPSTADGEVITSVVSDVGFGNYVKVNHGNVGPSGENVKSVYAHMQAPGPLVTVGAIVSQGYTLGKVGATGTATGAHLHFEIHVNDVPVNPRDFMAAMGL